MLGLLSHRPLVYWCPIWTGCLRLTDNEWLLENTRHCGASLTEHTCKTRNSYMHMTVIKCDWISGHRIYTIEFISCSKYTQFNSLVAQGWWKHFSFGHSGGFTRLDSSTLVSKAWPCRGSETMLPQEFWNPICWLFRCQTANIGLAVAGLAGPPKKWPGTHRLCMCVISKVFMEFVKI